MAITLYATYDVTQVTDTQTNVKMTLYASGSSTGGTHDVTLNIKNSGYTDSWYSYTATGGTIEIPQQSGGTTQIFTRNVRCTSQYTTGNGVRAMVLKATYNDGYADRTWEDVYIVPTTSGSTTGIMFLPDEGMNGRTIEIDGSTRVRYILVAGSGATWENGRHEITTPYQTWQIPVSEATTGVYSFYLPAELAKSFYGSASEYLQTTLQIRQGGSYYGYTATPYLTLSPDFAPEITAVHVGDQNGHGYPGDDVIDAFVQTLSLPKVWADVDECYESTIQKIVVSYAGVSVTRSSVQGVEATEQDPILVDQSGQTGDLEMTVTVTDNRGRSDTWTGTMRTAAYSYPSVSLSEVERWDVADNEPSDESTTVRTHLVGTMSPVNGRSNTGSIRIYAAQAAAEPDYQLQSTTNVTTTTSVTGFDKSIDSTGFSETEEWAFRWVLTDRFGQTVSGEVIVYGARPIMDFAPDGQSVGMWTTAGARQDQDDNPVVGLFVNNDVTIHEGFGLWGTGGADEGFMAMAKLLGSGYNYATGAFILDLIQHSVLANDRHLCGRTVDDVIVRLLGIDTSNRTLLNWTSGGLGGRVMKNIWSGNLSVGGQVSVAELPYYNVFGCQLGTDGTMLIGARAQPFAQNQNVDMVSILGKGAGVYAATVLVNGTSMRFEGCNVGGTSNNRTISKLYGIL